MCRVLLVTRGFCGGFCKWVGKERGNQRCGRGGAFLEKRTDLWYGDERRLEVWRVCREWA